MEKHLLILLVVLAIGISSAAYASSTSITNSYILTNTLNATTLNVSGFCNGCSNAENSYSNYNTVFLNTTVVPTIQVTSLMEISNSGYILAMGDGNTLLVSPTGNLLVSYNPSPSNAVYQLVQQSNFGEYQLVPNTALGLIEVYKNGVLLQSLGIKLSNFATTGTQNLNVAISPSGQYIVVMGENTGGTNTRVVIFKGS